MTQKTPLQQDDPELFASISKEENRQTHTLNLIPSENRTSIAVREACASVLMNKYSEGYSGKRYYQGNTFIDEVETLAIERCKKLFGADHANVQPLSGSPANFAIYLAFLEPGDTVLGMDLSCGGHLTHGSPVNFSGKWFNIVSYGVDKETSRINMEEVRKLALEHKPKLIISGHSAYPFTLDFEAFQNIAEDVGAIHLADMSHIAGLVATGEHPSPVPFADVVSSTTHKTLRGPRGAIILCKEKHAKKIDKAVFPGVQGGAHNNLIAAKAVAFKQASEPSFIAYQQQTRKNAQALAKQLITRGVSLVGNGTENHLMLIDLQPLVGPGMGPTVARALERAGICTNANSVPYDPAPPYRPSGIRIGTPMLTTQGLVEADMVVIGNLIADVLLAHEDESVCTQTLDTVAKICATFTDQ